jgi:predicted ArsR family transcriptional regulator
MSMDGHFSSVKTGVDALIDLLSQKQMISIDAAAKSLGVSAELLRSWVDLLVEEGIVGVEYKLVTAYIYLIKKNDKHDLKKEFYTKALAKQIPAARIKLLWREYLVTHLEEIRKEFYDKAMERSIPPRDIDKLWQDYYTSLTKD